MAGEPDHRGRDQEAEALQARVGDRLGQGGGQVYAGNHDRQMGEQFRRQAGEIGLVRQRETPQQLLQQGAGDARGFRLFGPLARENQSLALRSRRLPRARQASRKRP